MQSYAGGRNLWGPNTSEAEQKKYGFKQPKYNDGLLEVRRDRSPKVGPWFESALQEARRLVLHTQHKSMSVGVFGLLGSNAVLVFEEPMFYGCLCAGGGAA